MLLLPLLSVATATAATTDFAAGTYIIPMNTTSQDDGVIEAYGLVYALLRGGVNVHWAILEGKGYEDVDFTATTYDIDGAEADAADVEYRSGPFLIAADDVVGAEEIISAWRADHTTDVHVASADFSADIERVMRWAPSIAVFADGEEQIAFELLNAAGIPNGNGGEWPGSRDGTCSYTDDGYEGILCYDDIEGDDPAAIDGALFDDGGFPLYCHLDSMHYDEEGIEGLVQEIRQFVTFPNNLHLKQCRAAETIENEAAYGYMLTDAGLTDGSPHNSGALTFGATDSPYMQFEGEWEIAGGSLKGFTATSSYAAGVEVLVRGEDKDGFDVDIAVAGHLDGDEGMGELIFLSGHEYSTSTPASTNDSINGARVFLNSVLTTGCARADKGPDPSLDGTAEVDAAGLVTTTLDGCNDGPGWARDGELTLLLPEGLSYDSDDSGGVYDAASHAVVWELGLLLPEECCVTVTWADAEGSGDYELNATLDYTVGATQDTLTWSGTVSVALDTDGGGVGDGVEVIEDGTDPLNGGDDGAGGEDAGLDVPEPGPGDTGEPEVGDSGDSGIEDSGATDSGATDGGTTDGGTTGEDSGLAPDDDSGALDPGADTAISEEGLVEGGLLDDGKSGCSCAAGGSSAPGGAGLAGLALLVFGLARRRRS